ncbi:MAG: hypothetical protein KDA61_03945, partial [Planctomycetales bacterium]|nr:hypothetical protein [Planctomycetales bacterium]
VSQAMTLFALTIESSLEPPVDGVLLSVVSDDPQLEEFFVMDRGGQAETSYGQTFQFETPVLLDKITFRVRLVQDLSDAGLLFWMGTGYTGTIDSGISTLLVAEESPFPEGLTDAGQTAYLTVDFDDQLLAADRVYAFMPRFAAGGGVVHRELEIGFTGSDSYADGAAFTFNSPFAYRTIFDNELTFFLHGTAMSPADFDCDGFVGDLDFAIWEQQFNLGDAADADGDGDVDANDFLIWQREFGTGAVLPSEATLAVVPEPCAAIALAVGAVLLAICGRRMA